MKTALSVVPIPLVTKNTATNLAKVRAWKRKQGDREGMDRPAIEIDRALLALNGNTFECDRDPLMIDCVAFECDRVTCKQGLRSLPKASEV